jgi:hypothetical protein
LCKAHKFFLIYYYNCAKQTINSLIPPCGTTVPSGGTTENKELDRIERGTNRHRRAERLEKVIYEHIRRIRESKAYSNNPDIPAE